MAQDVQTMLREQESTLATSRDTGIEDLRWRVVRGEAVEDLVSADALVRITGQSKDWASAAFTDLNRTGFIRARMTAYVWARLDPRNLGLEVDILNAIEQIVALRFEYADCREVAPSLRTQLPAIEAAAESGNALALCFEVQRLLLALVAAMDGDDLMREYAAHARTAVAYGWSVMLGDADLPRISLAIAGIVDDLAEGRGKAAAAAISQMRRLPTG